MTEQFGPTTSPSETTGASWTTKRAWQLYDYADNLLAQRMNYGMVAQAMLLLSFVTLFVYQKDIGAIYGLLLEAIISFSGVSYSSFQYYRTHTLSRRLDFLRHQYLKDDPVWVDYSMVRSPDAWLNMDLRINQYQVPKGLIFVWLALLFVALVRFYFDCHGPLMTKCLSTLSD